MTPPADDRIRSLATFLAVELERGLCRVELRAARMRHAIATWSILPTDDARRLARKILERVDAEMALSREVVGRIVASAQRPALLIVRHAPAPAFVVALRSAGGSRRFKLADCGIAPWGVA